MNYEQNKTLNLNAVYENWKTGCNKQPGMIASVYGKPLIIEESEKKKKQFAIND